MGSFHMYSDAETWMLIERESGTQEVVHQSLGFRVFFLALGRTCQTAFYAGEIVNMYNAYDAKLSRRILRAGSIFAKNCGI